ncbi:hypothetical protein [Mitsuaria sp. 7]|uniref:hypothetical protein n=1 Tax=Mitsuaria sp. 7 TaxID=1658665 RepID=UPI0007DD1B3F|nr:hypothetical protein [Mitsuaria sp. 7]ANH68502.1 hypothetical protein ABE85_14665 [Mitsuaria sp. 7]
MIPSSFAAASGTAARDTDIDFEGHARAATPSPSFAWSLPADEVEKMERLERGQTLTLTPMVEACLNRTADVQDGWPDNPFRGVFFSDRRRHRPSDEEVAAMITEVPLCLLNGRQRLQALALRQQGSGAPDATAPDFDAHASREYLLIAIMEALHAVRGDTYAPWAATLARLARWETDVSSHQEADARASGGRALREVVKDTTFQVPLHLDGRGLNRQRVRQFALPPPALLAELGLWEHELTVILRHARPLDLDTFRDSAAALYLSDWHIFLNDDPDLTLPLIPDHAVKVKLWGDSHRCARLAMALAGEPARDLLEVWCVHPPVPAAAEDLPAAPDGWRFDPSATSWTLSRTTSPACQDPVSVLAFWEAEDPETLWEAIGASDDGPRLLGFLSGLMNQLTRLNARDHAVLRDETAARGRRLLQMLTARPALLSDLVDDLACGPWTCVDASRKTLANMELTLRACSTASVDDAAGVLLRLAARLLVDIHVGITDTGLENIEHGLALEALIDLRLAQITGKSFFRTGAPVYAPVAGMAHFVGDREPTLEDWSDTQRTAVERILGGEVRAGFPTLRELMDSTSGPAHRAVAQLLLDPSYQAANAAWEQTFLEADTRAGEDSSDVDAARRYEEVQEQMPLDLARRRFALMDDWLDPLRKAYPDEDLSPKRLRSDEPDRSDRD